MLAALDMAALLGGVGLVGWSVLDGARARACERAGGVMLVGALIGLGFLLVRSGG